MDAFLDSRIDPFTAGTQCEIARRRIGEIDWWKPHSPRNGTGRSILRRFLYRAVL